MTKTPLFDKAYNTSPPYYCDIRTTVTSEHTKWQQYWITKIRCIILTLVIKWPCHCNFKQIAKMRSAVLQPRTPLETKTRMRIASHPICVLGRSIQKWQRWRLSRP